MCIYELGSDEKIIEMRNEIRKQMKQKRSTLSTEFVLDASKQIRIKLNTLLKEDASIASYQPLHNEADVSTLKGKKLLFPKVIGEHEMEMVDPCGFEEGAFSILEPIGTVVLPSKIDVILVPLLAFDRKGNRLGYGKGYYDRYLQQFMGLKIGIAYAFQEVDFIETHQFDQSLDWIVTEQEVICITTKKQ